uniref:Uncharacterized protein n=1 Tax=Arundo donax TaxID=35708 RepID=A0A0A9AG43_ARUDO
MQYSETVTITTTQVDYSGPNVM